MAPSDKLVSARTLEDQDATPHRVVLGPIAHGSTSPHTAKRKSLAEVDLDSGSFPATHAEAAAQAAGDREDKADEDKRAGDWVALVENTSDQDALDSVVERYQATDREYATVDAAIEKRQAALTDDNQ